MNSSNPLMKAAEGEVVRTWMTQVRILRFCLVSCAQVPPGFFSLQVLQKSLEVCSLS